MTVACDDGSSSELESDNGTMGLGLVAPVSSTLVSIDTDSVS